MGDLSYRFPENAEVGGSLEIPLAKGNNSVRAFFIAVLLSTADVGNNEGFPGRSQMKNQFPSSFPILDHAQVPSKSIYSVKCTLFLVLASLHS